jgi:hypothetical protein
MIGQKNLLREEKGQTLLEVLLAFGVSTIVLGAIVFGITTSLSNTQYTKNQGLASSYVQEGMAVIRQIRDSSWSNFCSYVDSNYCLPQGAVTLDSNYDGLVKDCSQNGVIGIFARKIVITHNSEDCCPDNTINCPSGASCLSGKRGSKVTVSTSWTDNKCVKPYCHKVEATTCLSSIDLKPTP